MNVHLYYQNYLYGSHNLVIKGTCILPSFQQTCLLRSMLSWSQSALQHWKALQAGFLYLWWSVIADIRVTPYGGLQRPNNWNWQVDKLADPHSRVILDICLIEMEYQIDCLNEHVLRLIRVVNYGLYSDTIVFFPKHQIWRCNTVCGSDHLYWALIW